MMMKNYISGFSLIFLMMILSACVETRVFSNQAKNVDFTNFRTYAWLPINDTSAGSLLYNEIVEDNIVTKIDAEMSNRNYTLNTSDPDLLILLNLRLRDIEEEVVRRYPLYNTYPYYYDGFTPLYPHPYYYSHYNTIGTIYATEIDTVEFTTGTIIVDVIRNSDDKLIWRGWSQKRIDPETASDDLEKIIDKIFSEYPVAETSKTMSNN